MFDLDHPADIRKFAERGGQTPQVRAYPAKRILETHFFSLQLILIRTKNIFADVRYAVSLIPRQRAVSGGGNAVLPQGGFRAKPA
ncbi:hypothetical protein [Desulfovibrio sp.]|uniref:hypothetical protein n=1 Tax=Desulfovibrio sp. TaxID=885 RepID=UPI0025C61A8C|nr:hypothetical protein [Desulfovibrio sp.]